MTKTDIPQTSNLRKYLLIFNQPDGSEMRIRDENVFTIIEELDKISTDPEQTEIHLMLDSRGGNIYSAHKIINVLRSKCSGLVTIVPFRAKSAATLMALGSDYIVMAPFSELGPLDVPMKHPTLEGAGSFSALDGVKSIEFLANASIKLVYKFSSRVRESWGLSRKDCINAGLTFSANLLNPILSKLDPWTINKCERELCIAELYCIEFLTKYMLKNEHEAQKIAYKLKVEYPEHSFSISPESAKSLGINIQKASDFDWWNKIWKIYWVIPKDHETIKLITDYDLDNLHRINKKKIRPFKINAKM